MYLLFDCNVSWFFSFSQNFRLSNCLVEFLSYMIEEFVRAELMKLASLVYFMENSFLEIRREANCHIFKEATFSKTWIVGY